MAKKNAKIQEVQAEVVEVLNQEAEGKTEVIETTHAVAVQAAPVQEGYEVTVNAEGKYQRKAVYNFFSSIVTNTRAEKLKMFNLLNGQGGALPMGEHVKAKFKIQDVIFQPYDAVDEDTGELTNGVLTYCFDTNGSVYVTSSKSVYFTLKRAFQAFGAPTYSKEEALEVEIIKVKGKEFQYIDLNVIG